MIKPINSGAFLPPRRGVEEWSGEMGGGLVFVLSWEAWSVGRGAGLEDRWVEGGRAMVGMEGKGGVVDIVDVPAILCSYGAYSQVGRDLRKSGCTWPTLCSVGDRQGLSGAIRCS